MAWIGRDVKDHWVPSPVLQAGLPAAGSSTRSGCSEPDPIQPGPECLQGLGIHNLSGTHRFLSGKLPWHRVSIVADISTWFQWLQYSNDTVLSAHPSGQGWSTCYCCLLNRSIVFRGMLGILLFSLRIPSPDSLFAFILASYVSVPVFFFHFFGSSTESSQ